MRRWSLILSFLISLFASSHAMADSNWWEDKKTTMGKP